MARKSISVPPLLNGNPDSDGAQAALSIISALKVTMQRRVAEGHYATAGRLRPHHAPAWSGCAESMAVFPAPDSGIRQHFRSEAAGSDGCFFAESVEHHLQILSNFLGAAAFDPVPGNHRFDFTILKESEGG
jgi:hypothetical protein